MTKWIAIGTLFLAGCAPQPMPVVEVELKEQIFQAEVARTRGQITRGLQHRAAIGEQQAMLFVFQDEAPRSFWMHNTHIPLDILFFDRRGVYLGGHFQAPPCETPASDCPSYTSPGPAAMVLEVKSGKGQAMNLEPGKDQLAVKNKSQKRASSP